jgi:hypothetical protein
LTLSLRKSLNSSDDNSTSSGNSNGKRSISKRDKAADPGQGATPDKTANSDPGNKVSDKTSNKGSGNSAEGDSAQKADKASEGSDTKGSDKKETAEKKDTTCIPSGSDPTNLLVRSNEVLSVFSLTWNFYLREYEFICLSSLTFLGLLLHFIV